MSVKSEPKHRFASGATRSEREGKGRFDLIPPRALFRLARHYEDGGKVHGDLNWIKGFPISRAIDSCLRHINQYRMGDRSEDHIAAAAWQLFAIMEFEARIDMGLLPRSLDDAVW